MARKQSGASSGLAALFILCVVSLALFTVYIREGDCTQPERCGPLHTVQLGAGEVLRPVRSVVGAAAQPFEAAGDKVGNAFEQGEELQKLRKESQKNRELAAQASRLKRENDRLRELLEGERAVYEYSPLAEVIAPVGGQFTDRVVIDVGKKDGIKPQQPVVVGNNTLVGRTTGTVNDHTATVMLINDPGFAAGVRIVPPAEFDPSSGELVPAVTAESTSYGEGLLKTTWEGYLGVEYVDLSARAEKGDFVVTSGRMGDRDLLFPPGLLIGTVASVSSQDIDQYKKIVVEPAGSPDDLEEVRVIIDG